MIKMRKLLALTIIFAMTLTLLAGCSSDKKETETNGGDKTTVEESKDTTDETKDETPTEKTEVTVWTKDRHDADFMQALVDEYNATNTDNIVIKYEIYSDNYPQAVDMAFQSGEAPDMMVALDTFLDKYIATGKFADLTPFMDDEFKATFADNMIEGFNVIDGKCYYIPTATTSCRLFYNKDIFARLGIANPPSSLEEMIEISKRITSELSGEGIYGFAANFKNPSSSLGRSLIYSAQREVGICNGFDFAKGEYDFTGYSNVIAAWKELLSEESAFPGCESLDIDPLRTQFAAGKIGMYMSYTHAEPGVYKNQFPMEQEWGCAQIPTAGGVVNGAQNFSAINGYLFNAESENLDATWKVYTAVFANVQKLADYYTAGLGISSVKAAIELATPDEVYTKNPDLLVTATDKIYPKIPSALNPDGVVVEGQDLFSVFAEMIIGDLDIETGLQDLNDRYNKAYRAGIEEGIGKEIKIDNFDPMNPMGN
jgi:multiple sugar transport system substrate-binding protein